MPDYYEYEVTLGDMLCLLDEWPELWNDLLFMYTDPAPWNEG